MGSAVTITRYESLDYPQLRHGVANRFGGVSAPPFDSLNLSLKTGDDPESVGRNRSRLERAIGVRPANMVMGRLTHGSEVVTFARGEVLPSVDQTGGSWPVFDGDAAISNVPGLVMVMTFADCVPILLLDPIRNVCGLVHAGWRGTALRIGGKAVGVMGERFGCAAGDIRAVIGPSIGVCCYHVGPEVVDAFVGAYPVVSDRLFRNDNLDLWEANREDLLSAGLRPPTIELAGICTACNTEQFYSHRAEEGRTGRFGAFIGAVESR